MENNQRYQDLIVWQKAIELTKQIYKLTSQLPPEEIYGLTSQLKRAASSVPANIVEGYYRSSTKEFVKFLYNARGSLMETDNHLMLGVRLELFRQSDVQPIRGLIEEILKMTNSLIHNKKAA